MKKTFVFLLLALAGCAVFGPGSGGKKWASVADGFYKGNAQGYRGVIRVSVQMEGGSIAAIEVDSNEDPFVGGAAIDELLDLVIAHNTTDLDAVSGATESSRGFLEAVQSAIMGHE